MKTTAMMINLLPKSYHFLKSAILVVTKDHITLTDFIYRYFPLLGNEWKKSQKKHNFPALDKDDILHQKDHFQRSILKWNDGVLVPPQHFKKFIINRRTRGRSVVENTNEFWNSNVAKRWKHQLFSTPPRLPLAIIPLEEEEEREER